MLVAAAIIWGLAFVVMKDALEVMPTALLIGVRFTATGIILALVFWKRIKKALNREHLVYGLILGLILFVAFYVQTAGLAITSPGKNAFLTAAYVVFVPLIYWVVGRKRPSIFNFLAALICVAGVGLVSLQESLTMELGDLLTIIGAFLFGIHIVYVARWSHDQDVFVLTVYQFIVAGICGLICGMVSESWPPIEAVLNLGFLLNLGYLVIFGSCIALVFQNVALKHVPPTQVSLLLSVESVFGVIFSVLLYGEALTVKLVAGFCLIFIAILVSELLPLKKPLSKEQKTPEAALYDSSRTVSLTASRTTPMSAPLTTPVTSSLSSSRAASRTSSRASSRRERTEPRVYEN